MTICFGFIALLPANSLHAAYNWTLKKQTAFEEPPLAMAPSSDGRLVYVLLKRKVALYSVDENRVVETYPVDSGFNMITLLRDNQIMLSDSKSNLVKIFQLEKVTRINLEGLPFKGAENAPVVIAVYSDYQCPYCGRLEPLLKQFLDKYPKDLKLVFKNFPLTFHKQARNAAKAALAAHDQGRFQEFHARLFELGGAVNEDKIQEIAALLKLDIDRFIRKRNDPALDRLIDRDIAEAGENEVTGTPTVFVNNKLVKELSFEGFRQMIDGELKR